MSFCRSRNRVEFEESKKNEIAKVKSCNNPEYQMEIGKVVVRVDPNIIVQLKDLLIGDPTKIQNQIRMAT